MTYIETAEQLSAALGGSPGKKPGRFHACCPAHEDSSPSLDIDDKDGKVLLTCRAGCDNKSVIARLIDKGLSLGKPPEKKQEKEKLGPVVATYDYTDETGKLLHQTLRYDKPKKTFLQRRPEADGKWKWSLDGITTVPYNLPAVLKASSVVVVEGEKDVDRLCKEGITATCNAMGGGKWRDSYNQYFAGKKIVIIPDNDDTGKNHAQDVARQLHGVAKAIRVVNLPSLPPKGDTYDWFSQAGNDKAKLLELIKLAPEWEPPGLTEQPPAELAPGEPAGDPESKPLFICANELINRVTKIYPLIGKIIQRNQTGEVFGPSGEGKSLVVDAMGFAVGTGGEWNGNQCEKGLVVFFKGEGHFGTELRMKALHKHNGCPDMSNVYISRTTIGLDAKTIRQVITEVRAIEEATGQKVALIVIDTLARHIEGDENDTQAMTEFIKSVDGLRDAFPGASAIIVHHTGHSNDNRHRSRGSSALKAAMDFEILCDNGTLAFTKVKDGDKPPSTKFKIVPVEVGIDEDGEPITSCVVTYGERSAKQEAAVDALTGKETQALNALISVCIAENRLEKQMYSGNVNAWKKEFYRIRRMEAGNVKTQALNKAFQRAAGNGGEDGGLKTKGYVGFEERGAIPLRVVHQKHIFDTILTSDTRYKNDTLNVHVSNQQNDTYDTRSLKTCIDVPHDLSLSEIDITADDLEVL